MMGRRKNRHKQGPEVVDLPKLRAALPPYPALLKEAGYTLAHIGKTHYDRMPDKEVYDLQSVVGWKDEHELKGLRQNPETGKLDAIPENEHLEAKLVNQTLAWIGEQKRRAAQLPLGEAPA